MPQRTVRVFISSPSDVRPERLIAERVIRRLDAEFAYHFRVEPILWEREPLVAAHHFQDVRNIPPPRSTDIVVVVLWSRLGAPLPEGEFRGALSGRAVTGTEWEFEDALAGAKQAGVPDLLLYRKLESVTATLDDDAALEQQRHQKRLVEDFMARWFEGADTKSFTSAFASFRAPTEFEERLYEHLYALLERRAQADSRPGETATAIRWYRAPFCGLLSFEFEQAPIFFGRTRARNEVRELLARQAARGCAFVLVMGASGSGKSSLVKAGLLPDLMLPGMVGPVALCRHAMLRPSDASADLLDALAGALLSPSALPELLDLQYDRRALAGILREAPGQAALPIRQGLAAAGKAAQLTAIAESRLVLVVDQLEELFTRESLSSTDRDAFVRAIESLARSGQVWVIATMRSDFFDRLEAMPALAQLSGGEARYLLEPPDGAEIGQIVLRPAREAGLRFEADAQSGVGLHEAIRQTAAKSPGALPLLSFLLEQLWQRRTENGLLTFSAYEELGGLEGALSKRAEELFTKLPTEVQAALPGVLRALVTVGQGGGVVTSRPASLALFPDDSPRRRLVDAFSAEDARLLVKAGDAGGTHIRIAHEALLTHWERARDQIAKDRRDLQLRARLEQAAALWEQAEETDKESLLLQPGLPLAEAESLVERRGEDLDAVMRRFVEVSRRAATARERRRVRSLQVAASIFGAAALVASTLGYLAFTNGRKAEAQRIEAESNLGIAQNLTYTLVGDMAARIAALGDLSHEQRRRVVERSERLFGLLRGTSAGTPELLHEQATALNAFADAWMMLDDPRTAVARATDAQRLLVELTGRHPDKPEWLRSLALSYEKLGDARQSIGDLDGALAAHQEMLRIARDLLARSPTDPERQRDVMLAHSRLALEKLQRDGAVSAAADFREALILAEQRAANSADARAQLDLQWIKEKMAGDVAAPPR